MNKKLIRTQIRQKAISLSATQRCDLSFSISSQILSTPQWQQAHTILLYASLPDEVDTSLLLAAAHDQGKQIVLPVVCGNDMFFRIYSPHHTQTGAFGITEPSDQAQPFTELTSIDLAIIPGRAFTLQGDRLGRGKGYYDRTLSQLRCPLWGIAFPFQILPSLPVDEWDIPMHRVWVAEE